MRPYEEVPLLLLLLLLPLLLLPNALCVAAITPLYTFFQVQTEKPVAMFRVTGSALVASAALNVALVPEWDAKGAAVAASLGGIVAAVVAFRAYSAGAQTRLRDLRPGARRSGTTSRWWPLSPDAEPADGEPDERALGASTAPPAPAWP
jgi:hypothetical protein